MDAQRSTTDEYRTTRSDSNRLDSGRTDGGAPTSTQEARRRASAADLAAAERAAAEEAAQRRHSEPSLGQLFSDLSNDFSRLARQEIHLARAEVMQSVKRASGSAITIAAGGAIAYAGVMVLLAAATIALGAFFDNYALAALIVGAIVLVIGGILIASGQAALKRTNFVPEQTMQTLEDDAKWAKEQVTRE